ncbi:MAG: hypothetical protein PGN26_04340 [Xylophilus ampelinus]
MQPSDVSTPRSFPRWVHGAALACALFAGGCGGGGSGSGTGAAPPPSTHVLGGSIAGLAGAGLVIANGDDTLALAAGSTAFSMPAPVATGAAYALAVRTQPANQQCSFANASGTMPDADMRNAVLTCATTAYRVGGSIQGLSASGLVLSSGAGSFAVAQGSTSFTSPAPVAVGGSWSIGVQAQPAGQVCTVVNGSGQMGGGDVGSVEVRCAAAVTAWRLGGSVSGLAGGLVLANGSDTVTLASDGTFGFPTLVSSGAGYQVVVRTPPVGQSCTIAQGNGTMGSADVGDVAVTCVRDTYTLGGTITGLARSGLRLANGGDTLDVAANASVFTMGQPVAYGANYAIAMARQPFGFSCLLGNASGTMGLASVGNVTVGCTAIAYQVTTFAGRNFPAPIDGQGTNAAFSRPSGIAADGAGNLFVADTGNNGIRKITPGGAVTTFAGGGGSSGFQDGAGMAALFDTPSGVAVDGSGNVFVADTNNHVIRKIDTNGNVTTLAGSAGTPGYLEGTGTAAQFSSPEGVAVGADGTVYVADTGNHVIRAIATNGVVRTVAGDGTAGMVNALGTAAQFDGPRSVTLDARGNLFVADTNNRLIRRIAPDGTVSHWAGTGAPGFANGDPVNTAQFNNPSGVAVDANGTVFVADTFNSRIRLIAPDRTVETLAGDGTFNWSDGSAANARFFAPQGVAVTAGGTVFVADTQNHRIRKIAP